MLPPFLQKLAIAGLKRSALHESNTRWLEQLGIPAHTDNHSQTALDALAVGFVAGHVSNPPAHALFPSIASAPAERLPVCPPAARDCLHQIISVPYLSPVFTEFLECCLQYNVLFPPEALPYLFDELEQHHQLIRRWQPILGERAPWLAAQQPEWAEYFDFRHFDWKTARRGRYEYLQQCRTVNPAAATDTLMGTWKTEKTAHKIQFLQLFQHNPSAHDLPLVELAIADRSADVRRWGWALAARIPGRYQSQVFDFFRDYVQPALGSHSGAIKSFPAFNEPAIASWVALLDPSGVPDEWRSGLLALVLGWTPTERWHFKVKNALLWLDSMPHQPIPALENLLKNFALRAETPAIMAFFDYFKNHPTHPIWQCCAWRDALIVLPRESWQHVFSSLMQSWGDDFFLDQNQHLHKILLDSPHFWSRQMMTLFFQWLRDNAFGKNTLAISSSMVAALLHSAGLRCQIADVHELVNLTESLSGQPFFESDIRRMVRIAQFRRQMWMSFDKK